MIRKLATSRVIWLILKIREAIEKLSDYFFINSISQIDQLAVKGTSVCKVNYILTLNFNYLETYDKLMMKLHAIYPTHMYRKATWQTPRKFHFIVWVLNHCDMLMTCLEKHTSKSNLIECRTEQAYLKEFKWDCMLLLSFKHPISTCIYYLYSWIST